MENEKHIKAKMIIYLSNIVSPLLIGLIIYILYKPQALIVKQLNTVLPLECFKVTYSGNPLQFFLRNHFCDMCWSYAFTFSVSAVIGHSKKALICAVIINSVLSVLIEAAQYTGIIYGTLDLTDILLQVISGIIAAIIITFIFRRKNK